ncbi:MAG: protein kinase, partial [Phycisphaerales bacterium]|nr:protein kinase [Phycisphaerales bacterium]
MDEERTHDNPTAACPPIHVLQTLADGSEPDDLTRAHVNACMRCQHVLDTIFGDNDLLAELADAVEATVSEAATRADAPPTRIGEYEIQAELHRGGQGVVYKAWHAPTKRTVALKVMLQGAFASSRQLARFEREVELVASLRHPGIVTLYDSGVTSEGLHYLVMEYVEG